MVRICISLLLALCLTITHSSANTNSSNNQTSRISHGKSCSIQVGCYNATVTKPPCGKGTITYSSDLIYTVEFKVIGCDESGLDGAPVSWREINAASADIEISSCRNQYQCMIPRAIIQKRIGTTLVLEIWTSIAPLRKLVGLGVALKINPPVGYVVSTKTHQDHSTKKNESTAKIKGLWEKTKSVRKHFNKKSIRRLPQPKTFEDMMLEYLASKTKSPRTDQKYYRPIPRRDRYRVGWRTKIKHQKPGGLKSKIFGSRRHIFKEKENTRENIVGADSKYSVSGSIERVNVSNATVTTQTMTMNKTKSNASSNNKTLEVHNNSNLNIKTNVNKTISNTHLNVTTKVKPVNLNITVIKNGTWTKSGKPRLNVHRKMELRIKSNISDANAALDSILIATSETGRNSVTKKYHGHSSVSSKPGKHKDNTIDRMSYKCVKFLCGQKGRRWRCPKILVLQCLHLSSGERRQLMLGEIKGEMQQLINMFNVSKSDLKEIEKSAKASAHLLMKQSGNADNLSKKIGVATAEILRKLYNASFLASRTALRERFGLSGTTSAGDLGEWNNWSSCSVSCGSGITIRSRGCPQNSVGCKTKPKHQRRKCMETACPKATIRKPPPWSSWSACSVTCGLGKETRTRDCDVSTGQGTKQVLQSDSNRCKGPVSMTRHCIMSSCNADSNLWKKVVLLGYDTVLNCESTPSLSSTNIYWITPQGKRVSRTTQLQRLYMVGNTLVIHGSQKTDEGIYHCIINKPGSSGSITTDTRIEVLNCASAPCENGGTCKEGLHKFNNQLRKVTCLCTAGYGGDHCQDHITHSHFRLYLFISLLIGLLVSSLLGFLVYICAFRKINKDNGKKTTDLEKKTDKGPGTLKAIIDEHNVSVNLDSSIVHSDDSWIEITEKDYEDFEAQKTSKTRRKLGPVSQSLPTLNGLSRKYSKLHPLADRKTRSNTETSRRKDNNDSDVGSLEHSDQPRGYAYEVPTSPNTKTKILLIQKDRMSKSSPNLRTKKSVSFQSRETNNKVKNAVSHFPLMPSPGGQVPPETSSPGKFSSASTSAKMSTATSLHQGTSARRLVHMSTSSPSRQVSTTRSGKQMTAMGPVHQQSPSIPSDHHSSGRQINQISTDGPVSGHLLTGQIPTVEEDYVNISGSQPKENELVIVTSDSIVGLHSDTTEAKLNDDVQFVHNRTSTRGQSTSSKLADSVNYSGADMDYTPVYYTHKPSPSAQHDMYVETCQFVHKNTFTPEQQDTNFDYEQLYINLAEEPETYPDYETPNSRYQQLATNRLETLSPKVKHDSSPNSTNLENEMPISEDVSLFHETNSSNHSYREDDPMYKTDQITSNSNQQHVSTSIEDARSSEFSEIQAPRTTSVPEQSTAFESDEECYESDQSSTLCPMPDLNGSGILNDESWDATLKGYSFDKIDESADLVENLVRSFESDRNKSYDFATKTESVSKLPGDTKVITPMFDVSLGDLLNDVSNVDKLGYVSDEKEKEQNSIISSGSSSGERIAKASDHTCNDNEQTEIGQSSKTSNSKEIDISGGEKPISAAKTSKLSPSSPRTRMCRGHYEMVYGPVSYPSPICQLDTESECDTTDMTEDDKLPQIYPIEHHYASKSQNDFH
ncbi:uncharacterized protein [Argopecten irradians]|uniref:uncharacterized protein isoform X2 n=1 Tax=Argopecten irradians TaxID=31199 RepID=UPI003721D007